MADMAIAVAAILFTVVVANLERMPDGFPEFLAVRLTVKNFLALGLLAAFWNRIFHGLQVYAGGRRIPELIKACMAGAPLFLLLPVLSNSGAYSIWAALVGWLAAAILSITVRYLVLGFRSRYRGRLSRNLIIVGSGPRAQQLYQGIRDNPDLCYNLFGFVDSNFKPVSEEIGDRMLGTLEDLEAILMDRPVDEVLVALPIKSCYDGIQRAIYVCEKAGVACRYLCDVFRSEVARRCPERTEEDSFVSLEVVQEDARHQVKWVLDMAGALAGIVLLAPLMLLITVVIKLTSPGPAIFRQLRYGRNRRLFRMYKFRTMVAGAEEEQASLEPINEAAGPVFKIKNDPRITRFGRLLRKTSLDELPQLFNVLLGQMSLVGPRPLPIRDVERFDRISSMRRFSVRPGITCLWQVNGRSDVDFDHWIELDLEYIDNWSLGLDFKILAQTLPAVVKGVGAA